MNGHCSWPLLEVVSSNEDYKRTDSHNFAVIIAVPSLAMLEGRDSK
jgi:hypothetical protein